jgi:hypothetical protein
MQQQQRGQLLVLALVQQEQHGQEQRVWCALGYPPLMQASPACTSICCSVWTIPLLQRHGRL